MYIQMTELFPEKHGLYFSNLYFANDEQDLLRIARKRIYNPSFYEKIIPFSIVVVCPSFRGLR